jgi:hypothetical protein
VAVWLRVHPSSGGGTGMTVPGKEGDKARRLLVAIPSAVIELHRLQQLRAAEIEALLQLPPSPPPTKPQPASAADASPSSGDASSPRGLLQAAYPQVKLPRGAWSLDNEIRALRSVLHAVREGE